MSTSRISEKLFTDGETGRKGISRRDFLKLGGAGLAGATMLGVTGCGSVFGGGNGGGGGSNSKTLNVFFASDIDSIDPSINQGIYGACIIQNVMDGLYRLDEKDEPTPAQATSVDISDDKKKYTFHLRDGIKWSNGDPVTSQDFKYAWLRALDPKTASVYAYDMADYVKGASEYNSGKGKASDVAIQTPDDKTLVVELVNPVPYFLNMAANLSIFKPLNQKFVEKQGKSFASSPSTMLYNGPYKLTSYDPNNGATMVKNKGYWDAKNVQVEKVNQKVIKQYNTSLNLYQSGQLDQVSLHQQDIPKYKNSKDFSQYTDFGCYYAVFNMKDPVLKNANIRKALQTGWDIKTLQNKVLGDGSVGAYGMIPPGIKGPGNKTFREAQGNVIKYDPQKAKQYWQQGVKELGHEPTISMLTADNTRGNQISTYLQGQYKKNLGANTKLDVKPFKQSLDLQEKGNYQMGTATGWVADYNDPMTFLDLFTSDSSFNYPQYSSQEYDSLISGARKEPDENKRMQMLLKAERVLILDGVAIGPQYYSGYSVATKPRVKKWVIHKELGQPTCGDYKYWRVA